MKIPRPPANQLAGWIAVTWLLFASFTYYVSFVQYALLGRASIELGLTEFDLAPGFGLLALFGIAGSLLAGYIIDRRRLRPMTVVQGIAGLSGALGVCTVIAMQAASRLALIAVFAPMGLALGMLIVALLQQFSLLLPGRIRGIFAGLAAGFVYLAANVLAVFSDSPDMIGLFDLVLTVSNIVVVFLFYESLAELPEQPYGEKQTIGRMLPRLLPLAAVVLVDTALFVLVSRAPGQTPVFGGSLSWIGNGFVHLVAAAFAGVMYARLGWRKINWFAAAALVGTIAAFAAHRFGAQNMPNLIILLYSATVGAYTVSLFTVYGEETPKNAPATGIAWGMVLVGWLCSPAGIAIGTALLPLLAK